MNQLKVQLAQAYAEEFLEVCALTPPPPPPFLRCVGIDVPFVVFASLDAVIVGSVECPVTRTLVLFR